MKLSDKTCKTAKPREKPYKLADGGGLYLSVLFFLLYSFSVSAADIAAQIDGIGDFRQVVIEGQIEHGDFDRFIKIIEENQGKISGVYIFSSGGNFDEAMKIGRALSALELSSQVPMQDKRGLAVCSDPELESIGISKEKPKSDKNCTCASACFFIHIGAFHRGGTFLAVHRPYFEKGMFGQLSESAAKKEFDALQTRARNYMQEMSVPLHIQESVLATPSDRILLLEESAVRTHFWGKPPHIEEWIKNRCSQIDAPVVTSNEYDPFQTKEHKELECAVKIMEDRRLDAYRKYFEKEPSISNSHDFSKWASAISYLGKDFYEILGEERFEEDEFRSKFAKVTSLSRAATAKNPYIYLSDSEDNLRVVSEVTLTSPKNPPDDFLNKLMKTLFETLGAPQRVENKGEWEWRGEGYAATLSKMYLGEDWLWQMEIKRIQ